MPELPGAVLAAVCGHVGSARALKRVRLAARRLLDPGAQAIKVLRAPEGQMPPQAWTTFSRAAGLVVQISDPPPPQLAASLRALAQQLPGRVERIRIEQYRRTRWHALAAAESRLVAAALQGFADALVNGAPCAAVLQRLECTARAGFGFAESLLRGLPALQHLQLHVMGEEQEQGDDDDDDDDDDEEEEQGDEEDDDDEEEEEGGLDAPPVLRHLPAQLQALDLRTTDLAVDLAGLGACSQLRSLKLAAGGNIGIGAIRSAAALAGCTSLEQLELEHMASEAREATLDFYSAAMAAGCPACAPSRWPVPSSTPSRTPGGAWRPGLWRSCTSAT
jgi:hypothetical protein